MTTIIRQAEDAPIRPPPSGKAAAIDDPDVTDERYAADIEGKPWQPSVAGETIADYERVRPIPGLTMKQTRKRLEALGVTRRDVLISARARYYWVNPGKACPFPTGPNNEISRHDFEEVRGFFRSAQEAHQAVQEINRAAMRERGLQ